MRTTIDIEDGIMRSLHEHARMEDRSLKDTLHDCLEQYLGFSDREGGFKATTYHMGGMLCNSDTLWDVADSLEEEAYRVKRELQK